MPTQMLPVVVDLSHHNEVEDWGKVYAAGIRGVIHKATQGTGNVDPTYASRKAPARAAGLLWAAYHFADGSDVTAQVDHFLSVVQPDDKTLLVLDFEPNGASTMSLDQAREFLQQVYDKTGQRPVLYSGNLIKEGLGSKVDPFFAAHRLWICQYGPVAKLQASWSKYWLWQFCGDGVGPLPHEIDGIASKGIDLNVFGGTDLAAEWVQMPNRPAPQIVPERADATIADLQGQSRTVDGMVLLRKVGIGIGGASAVVGAGNETTTPVPQPLPADTLSLDGLAHVANKASESVSYVQTLTDTLHTATHILSQNGWLLGLAAGGGAAWYAHSVLGWRLEEYIWGRWHPKGD